MTSDDAAQTITHLLTAEGLEFEFKTPEGYWDVFFDLDAQRKLSRLLGPTDDGIIVAASLIDSPTLDDIPLESLGTETLAVLLTKSSAQILAKVTYFAERGAYVATSGVMVDGVTGSTLRMHLEACAHMAVAVEKALAKLSARLPTPA